jgi:hypothetical protein
VADDFAVAGAIGDDGAEAGTKILRVYQLAKYPARWVIV